MPNPPTKTELRRDLLPNLLPLVISLGSAAVIIHFPDRGMAEIARLAIISICLIFPPMPALTSLAICSLTLAAVGHHDSYLVHTTCFALVTLLSTRLRFLPPPFVSVGFLWCITLWGAPLLHELQLMQPHFVKTTGHLFALIEICFVAGISFASGRFFSNSEHKTTPIISSHFAFVLHSVAVSSYAFIVICLISFPRFNILSAQDINVALHHSPILLISLIYGPILIGIITALPLAKFLMEPWQGLLELNEIGEAQLAKFMQDEHFDHQPYPIELVARQTQRAQALKKLTRKTLIQLSNTQNRFLRIRNICKDKRQTLDEICYAFENSPQAAATIDIHGTIQSANERLCLILGISRNDFVGQHYSYLNGDDVWCDNIAEFIKEVQESHYEFDETIILKKFTRQKFGYYLELHACLTDLTKNSAQNGVKKKASPGTKNFAIILTVEAKRYNLDILEHCIRFNRSDIIGIHALDVCRRLNPKLTQLQSEFALVLAELRAHKPKKPSSPTEILITNNSKKIEALNNHVEEAQSTLEKVIASTKDINSIFEKHAQQTEELLILPKLKAALSLWANSRGQASTPQILLQEMALENHVGSRRKINPCMKTNPTDLDSFVMLLISLLSYAEITLEDLKIILAIEKVGAEGAKILPSLSRGDYCVITMEIASRISTPNLAANALPPISSILPGSNLERCIYLLTLHTKFLGGFFSLRSSPGQGTIVTTYLPIVDLFATETAATHSSSSLPVLDFVNESKSTTEIQKHNCVILCHDNLRANELLTRIADSNLSPKVRHYSKALEILDSTDSQPGLGFSNSPGNAQEDDSERLQNALIEYLDINDKLFLLIDTVELDQISDYLIRTLHSISFPIPVIALINEDSPLEHLTHWYRIPWPLSSKSLDSLLAEFKV